MLLAMILVNMPPFIECTPDAPSYPKLKYWSRATQVVAQPWWGPHHVYGRFVVPVQYKRHRLYTAKLMIQGLVNDLPEISPEAGSIYGDQVDSEHYVMRVHLPTRTAIWLLLTGRFGDLRLACHWWLVMADR